jgi:hypothetical protein
MAAFHCKKNKVCIVCLLFTLGKEFYNQEGSLKVVM